MGVCCLWVGVIPCDEELLLVMYEYLEKWLFLHLCTFIIYPTILISGYDVLIIMYNHFYVFACGF